MFASMVKYAEVHLTKYIVRIRVNVLLSSADNFCEQLDPDQDRQNVGPDLDPNCFDTLMVFLKEYFEKVDFEKNQQTTKNMQNYPGAKS